MTVDAAAAASRRAEIIRTRMRRNKLVFVQCGAAFSVLRAQMLEIVGGCALSLADIDDVSELTSDADIVSISEVEILALTGEVGRLTMGRLRVAVDALLDAGKTVCLLSRAPKISYRPVPGSSVVEDAATVHLPVLGIEDGLAAGEQPDDWKLPAAALGESVSIDDLLADIIRELGVNLLAALDHAVFDSPARTDVLPLLEAREREALRGAGLVEISGEDSTLTLPRRQSELRESLSRVLADVVAAQPELGEVVAGLWLIERTIRRDLRASAIAQFATRWRSQALHGDLNVKVLERARADSNVTATSVGELRDPTEWLTLGELMEVAQRPNFSGLAFDDVAWRHFASEVLPVRNRVSHMRLLKKGDAETIRMWSARVIKVFG